MKIGCHVRLCGQLFRRLIKSWRERNNSKLQGELSSLLKSVSLCKTRRELEELLGLPKYAMPGELFSIKPVPGDKEKQADIAECYEVGQLAVDLVFKDGRIRSMYGYVKPNRWDVVCSNPL